jgi:hypothetical protein
VLTPSAGSGFTRSSPEACVRNSTIAAPPLPLLPDLPIDESRHRIELWHPKHIAGVLFESSPAARQQVTGQVLLSTTAYWEKWRRSSGKKRV